ncbi:type II secretion system F family protein [Pseudomonas aeruginosa]|uniref:type II secretion system F family protein n=1 Tax=Pseudomonas aeruginosa TaxID=287 RepID=UPI0037706491
MGGFWEQLQFAFYSKQFGRKERLQFYESMSTLLENGVPLKDAVAEVHKIFAHEGQHPFHPVAIASREALMGLSNGKRLATAMALYLPAQERALIEAGEMSGNLVQAMGDAVSLVEAQARIRATIWQALLYPSALSAMMVFLLCIVAYRMVPSLARLSDPVTWTGPLATLNAIASFVTGPGIYVLVAVITLTVVVIVTLPTYRWKGRVWLDRMLPPWSIYRMLQGTTFLLNMAVMLNAGIRPYDSLASMIKISPPWLKQRLEAARYGVGLGQNLGVALRSAGHDFPDRQAIQYLCTLANRGGFSEALVKFSRRWQETSLKQIELAAGLVKNFALIFIGALMILVLLGAYQAQQLIQSMNH